MAANYNCLLLDVDGTLLDFASAEQEAIEGTLRQFDLPADEETKQLYSSINADLWKELEKGNLKKERLVINRFEKLLEALGKQGDAVKMNSDFLTRLSQGALPYPGVHEVLEELAEFATLAVVSNGVYTVQMSRLKKAGLLPYFDDVFISEKVGCTKPSSRFFEVALRSLGIKNKAKVLVIGDSLTADIKGGAAAKLDTCWCNFTDAENTTNIAPTYTVRSLEEIKYVAVGKEELELAANREKRHTV